MLQHQQQPSLSSTPAHSSSSGSSAMQRTLKHAFDSSAAQRRRVLTAPTDLISPTDSISANAAYSSSFPLLVAGSSSVSSSTALVRADPAIAAAVDSLAHADPTVRRSVAATEAQLAGLHESLRRFTHARLEQERLFRAALPTAAATSVPTAAVTDERAGSRATAHAPPQLDHAAFRSFAAAPVMSASTAAAAASRAHLSVVPSPAHSAAGLPRFQSLPQHVLSQQQQHQFVPRVPVAHAGFDPQLQAWPPHRQDGVW
jgi:hypothetical protein